MPSPFSDRLIDAVRKKQTPLVVGLDPRLDRLPSQLRTSNSGRDPATAADAFEKFCCGIIDVVECQVAAVKPQAAFFEMLGPPGMSALFRVVQHARAKGLIVIMDAKRGDIGSTAEAYAQAYLGDEDNSAWACDCLTVNPYLGDDSLQPFVDRCQQVDCGIFVLVRTSNPGGSMIQETETRDGPLFYTVADHVQQLSARLPGRNGYGSIGAVIGATHPEQLSNLRSRMPNTIFLVPGIGAQGATAKDLAGAFDSNGLGAIINSSRAIIFAWERDEYSGLADDWQRAVEAAAEDTIADIAAETSAGKLLQSES